MKAGEIVTDDMVEKASNAWMIAPLSSDRFRAALAAVAPLFAEQFAKVAELDVDWVNFGKRDIPQWDGGPDAVRDYRLGIVAGRAIATAIRTAGASND
jgi:hypothetical protein